MALLDMIHMDWKEDADGNLSCEHGPFAFQVNRDGKRWVAATKIDGPDPDMIFYRYAKSKEDALEICLDSLLIVLGQFAEDREKNRNKKGKPDHKIKVWGNLDS